MSTPLEPDDVVKVPKRAAEPARFSVTGYVNVPGSYVWEAGMTLERALALAGGPSTRAPDPAVLAGWVADSRREWQRAGVETSNRKAAWETLSGVDLSGDPVAASQAAASFARDRLVVDYSQQILDQERRKKQLLEVEKLGLQNTRVTAVDTDLAALRSRLKARLVQIVAIARQEFENAQASEARYKELYLMQNAVANLEPGAGAPNRAAIERKDPKTGKVISVKLNKDPMTTPIEPGDVIKVPKRRM
jgi:hypothetical protein